MPEGVTGTPYERGWSIVGLEERREAAHRGWPAPHLGILVGLGLGGATSPSFPFPLFLLGGLLLGIGFLFLVGVALLGRAIGAGRPPPLAPLYTGVGGHL